MCRTNMFSHKPSSRLREGIDAKPRQLTVFSNEYRHLNRVAHIYEFVEVSSAFALTNSRGPAKMTAVSEPAFDVSEGTFWQREQLKALLQQYRGLFLVIVEASSDPSCQTPHRKWRIRPVLSIRAATEFQRANARPPRSKLTKYYVRTSSSHLKSLWAFPMLLVNKDGTMFLCRLSLSLQDHKERCVSSPVPWIDSTTLSIFRQ